jgi:hypothetical protein
MGILCLTYLIKEAYLKKIIEEKNNKINAKLDF